MYGDKYDKLNLQCVLPCLGKDFMHFQGNGQGGGHGEKKRERENGEW